MGGLKEGGWRRGRWGGAGAGGVSRPVHRPFPEGAFRPALQRGAKSPDYFVSSLSPSPAEQTTEKKIFSSIAPPALKRGANSPSKARARPLKRPAAGRAGSGNPDRGCTPLEPNRVTIPLPTPAGVAFRKRGGKRNQRRASGVPPPSGWKGQSPWGGRDRGRPHAVYAASEVAATGTATGMSRPRIGAGRPLPQRPPTIVISGSRRRVGWRGRRRRR
jgi:hypothetical protein